MHIPRRQFISFMALAAMRLSLYGQELILPLKPNSVRFAVIGDMGTGELPQYEIAAKMNSSREIFHFDFVLMLGDNIYGGHNPADYHKKFELPYKPLLDAGVRFYGSLGNHDSTTERFYKPF
jgi:Calcineurin-like phosphoesterase